jgi:hypothetical protein
MINYHYSSPNSALSRRLSGNVFRDIHSRPDDLRSNQVLWLDQRGTGLSTPLTPDTLPSPVKSDEQIAAYLKHFRQDNIGMCYLYRIVKPNVHCDKVRDCEAIRRVILGHRENPEDRKWTLLGQSFGGFCAITYLSFFSEGIKEVFTTGGLAPLVEEPDAVYAALVRKSNR